MISLGRSGLVLLMVGVLSVVAVACSSPPDETPSSSATATPAGTSTSTPQTEPTDAVATSTRTTGPGSPTATSAPGATPAATNVPVDQIELSDPELPRAPVRFSVKVPDNTPPGDDVYVMIGSVDDVIGPTHVKLSSEGGDVYSGEVDLPVGGHVRYAYDRWDETGCCADTQITRESLFTGDPVGYRSLIVPDTNESAGRMLVRDVVPQWNDLKAEFEQVGVSGRVVDSRSLEPVMDIDVTVGGVHVATDFDGRFVVPGIIPGVHRIVVTSVTGEYLMWMREVEVPETGLDLDVDISVRSVETVPVTFTVVLPNGTPPDAGVFVAGNLRQLGGRPSRPNTPAIASGIGMPIMERSGDIATLSLDLPIGAYVEYFYTLGSDASAEVLNHNRRFRNFIVGDFATQRNDAVASWGNEGWPLTTLRVEVPINTPEGVPVFFRDGPTYQMNRVGPHRWVTVIGSHPPGTEYGYIISLGGDMYGADGSPDADGTGRREITIPDNSTEIAIKVSKWAHMPDPTLRDERGGLTVKFRLSVPPGTPENATIVLTGNRPAVGAQGTVMEQVPGNPWLYEADINFGHDGQLRYRYTVSETGNSSKELTINTDFHGQEVNDYVASWDGSEQPRDGWVSGLFLPDFWSEGFLPSSGSAFEAGDEVNGEWIVISSVWSFGEILPEPFIESRPVRIWTVLTPIDDIRAQAAVAREKGKKIFLAPQMNPEVQPDWLDQTASAGSREWWDQWLEQAEAQWMWNAIVGEEIGAEMLMLPGYVFHVFPPIPFFHDESYAPEFDLKVQELIRKVREVYSGKIMISGNVTEYDFPGLADYVGVTTFDIGVPQLPADATFEDLSAHYAAGFEASVDNKWERWGKPVMLYTIHANAKPQDGDEFGQLFQAAAHEAMFHEIDKRPFIAGSFSWAFDYVGVWQFDTDSVRDRAAGAVLAKWYERLGG